MITFKQFLEEEISGTTTGSVAGIGTGPPDQSEPPGKPKRSLLIKRKGIGNDGRDKGQR